MLRVVKYFAKSLKVVQGHSKLHRGAGLVERSFLSFFLIWGGTRSLRMPALRPASQAGPIRNPSEGTSVVLRDTIRLT